jgi:radical SAM superfamily enzyme YgiQ (UPF0313 family)
MGLEGKQSQYHKLQGTDTHALISELQAHGIRILGSTIIGLEEHTPENLPAAIEHAVSHDTEFHQFMLYTPVPGTALFEEHRRANTLLDPNCEEPSDVHGQLKFVHRHPHIPPGDEEHYLVQAFLRDFEVNGPSVMRMARGTLRGWKRFSKHPDARIRRRFRREGKPLRLQYPAVVWATRHWFRKDPVLRAKADALLKDLIAEFGPAARVAASVGGRVLYKKMKSGKATENLEPPTFYEPVGVQVAC